MDVRSFFLVTHAASGALDPFISVVLSRQGLAASLWGNILSVRSAMPLLFSPVFSAVADKTRKHALVASLCLAASAASALGFIAASHFATARGVTGIALAITLGIPTCLLSLFRSPIAPLTDSAVMRRLGGRGPKAKAAYGKIRVFGAIGYGLAGTLVGVLLPRLGDMSTHVFNAVLMLLSIPIALNLFSSYDDDPAEGGRRKEGGKGVAESVPFLDQFVAIFRARGFAAFSFTVLALGFTQSTLTHFVPLFLFHEPGVSKGVLGWAVAVKILSEFPFYFASEKLVQQFGPRKLILVSHVGTAIRFLGLTLLSGNALLLTQLLHGVSFTIMWVSTVLYVDEVAPRAVSATAHGIVSAIYAGLASLLSSLIGGIVYDRMGPVAVFRIAILVSAVSFFVFASSSPRSRSVPSPGMSSKQS